MKNMIKLGAILLFCITIYSPLFSCSQGSGEPEATTSAAESDANIIIEEEEITADRFSISDNLPSDLNYNGETIRVWGRAVDNVFYDTEWEFVEEMNGEVFNDAMYDRELAVEGRLNINIEKTLTTTSYQNAYKAVKAGDDSFDILFANAYDVASHGLEGIYVNLVNFPYIDYDMP